MDDAFATSAQGVDVGAEVGVGEVVVDARGEVVSRCGCDFLPADKLIDLDAKAAGSAAVAYAAYGVGAAAAERVRHLRAVRAEDHAGVVGIAWDLRDVDVDLRLRWQGLGGAAELGERGAELGIKVLAERVDFAEDVDAAVAVRELCEGAA